MEARARRRGGILLGVLTCSVVAVVGQGACSDTLQGGIAIVTGPDNGFTQNPQPTLLNVHFVNPVTGDASLVATTKLPSDGSLSLPPQPGSNVEVIQVTGFDDAGDAVVSGTTIPVALDQLNGITLNVFAQRTGQFSRLPSADGGTAAITLPSPSPLLTTLFSRYLLISNSTGHPDATATQLYDTLTWSAGTPPNLTIPATSLAYVDTYTGSDAAAAEAGSYANLLEIATSGAANWLDLTDSTSSDAEVATDAQAPTNLPFLNKFAEVAGGQTVIASTGNTYIVGATRLTGEPTKAILRISPTGVLSWATLSYARFGAAAVFTSGGLAVFGGNPVSDASSAQSGVEFLPDDNDTAATPSPGLPADTTTGAGAVALDPNTILLVGGVTAAGKAAPSRLYTVTGLNGADGGVSGQSGGDGGNAAGQWALPPETLVTARVFALSDVDAGGGSAIVVGTTEAGVSSAYTVTPTSATLVPFQAARTNAKAALLPNGSLVVVGGTSGTLESFIP